MKNVKKVAWIFAWIPSNLNNHIFRESTQIISINKFQSLPPLLSSINYSHLGARTYYKINSERCVNEITRFLDGVVTLIYITHADLSANALQLHFKWKYDPRMVSQFVGHWFWQHLLSRNRKTPLQKLLITNANLLSKPVVGQTILSIRCDDYNKLTVL